MNFKNSCLAWSLCASLLTGLGTAPADANGRFPRAQVLKSYKDDLALTATFGMMVSADKGKSWYFVCETSLTGRVGAETEIIDLFLERGSDGALISGSYRGLRVSRDLGCTWRLDPTLPVARDQHDPKSTNPIGSIIDVTPMKAKSDKAFLVAASLENDAGLVEKHLFYESLDDAQSFKPVGNPISAQELSSIFTIDVAPNDAQVIYMTGVLRQAPGSQEPLLFWVSRDGGKTFLEKYPITDSGLADGAYIAAIHPQDPNTIFVRLDRWEELRGGQAKQGIDRVLVTRDGGKTWNSLIELKAKALGFALSPDGKTVLIGYGNPGNGGENTDPDAWGIYKGSMDDLARFERIQAASVTCLTWNSNDLYACELPIVNDFLVGQRPDAQFTMADEHPFTVLLQSAESRGPLPWTGERGDACMVEWLGTGKGGVCDTFSQCPRDGGPPAVGAGPPLCKSGASGAGGSSGAAGASGSPGTGGNAGPGPGTGNSSNCGCQIPGTGGKGALFGMLFGAIAVLARRKFLAKGRSRAA